MTELNFKHKTLSDWLIYLERLHPKVIDMGLDRVNQVKTLLNLTPRFPIITVGGTNGKGSTCIMMESIMSRAGYQVGCYISPHLLRYNERIRINRQEVSDKELCEAFSVVEVARMKNDVSLTYFEFGTLAAMQLFIEAKVDIVILEVGLGGRLDAVNVFDADCAVLTSIDLDHIDYLGDTREKIGFEKAGIFRRGKAAICSELNIPVSVSNQAELIGADFMRIGEHFGHSDYKNSWNYWSVKSRYLSLPHPALRGVYQLRNASACLTALNVFKDSLPITLNDIRQGLLDTELPGRFQVLPGRPITLLDVAHNPSAVRALGINLAHMDRYRKTYAVFAVLKDKDMIGIVQALMSKIDVWLVASIGLLRGASADEIVQVLKLAGIKNNGEAVFMFPDPVAAYVFACKKATEDDRICVFGSFHTVSEIMRYRNLVKYHQ
ncbi:MAG: bifunctional tetrahydrofolate synthase/dihydrofolate synthase [Nitrosomonadaceae bacterium]|nr:bifunctional tetrahydrofolate synthase/dihydrofolate synthase [Nitrosospira sp.]MSQ04925.1 bifunctional tetrahydrofolate synthase/dihydrofolate synthase [Nitrosomonadaceae bacterium]